MKMSFLNPKILDVIACPICKGKLHYDKSAHELICNLDRLAFPVRNGVPIMVEKEARVLNERYKES